MEQPNELEKQDKKKINEDMVMFMRKRSAHDAPRYTARLKTYVDIQRKRRRAAAARRNSEHSNSNTDNKTSSPTAAMRKKSGDEQKDKDKDGAADQPNPQDGGQMGRASRLPTANSAELCSIVSNSSESVVLASGPQLRHHHHHHHHHGHHHHEHDCECERGWFGRRGAVEEKQARGRSASRTHSDDLSDRCGRRRRRRRRSCRRRRRRRRRSCRRRRRRRRSCRRRRRRRRSCRRRRRRRRSRRRRRRRC